MELKNKFVHHVFFYLKNPDSREDKELLIQGLRKLSQAPIIKVFHIGEPADTHREVIERGYAVSWMILFDTAEEQELYQSDPIHLLFVKECSHLWSRVVVYDSVNF
jgi:phosphoribosylanthranilate isomerase